MNIENKKTALSDDADLYKHPTDGKTEKEKLSEMSGSKKWQYFKHYYLLKVILGIAGAGVLVAILVSVFSPKKENVFYACVFDSCIYRDTVYTIKDDFENSLALDTEKYETTFDMDFVYNGPYSEAVQRFATLCGAGEATVALMPESIFKMFARNNYFENLDDLLTDEEEEYFKDYMEFVAELDSEGLEVEGSLKPYGIVIDTCGALSENQAAEPVVLGFVVGQQDRTYALDFLKFLFAKE